MDLEEVVREYRHKPQDNRVDYALFIFRSPFLFVEAKDLNTPSLDDRKWVSQILGYATVVGVEWCVLTNGDEYRLYNAHAPVGVDEKLFRVVRISDPAQDKYALSTLDLLSKANMGEKLIDALWKAHFVDHHVKIVLDELLNGENRNLVNWIHRKRPELTRSDIRESLHRADVQVDFPVITPQFSGPPSSASKPTEKPRASKARAPKTSGVSVSDLIATGLIVPPLELVKDYKGAHLVATVQQDGRIVWDGTPYDSLSTAAGMARKSVIGPSPGRRYPQTNGWTFWRFRDTESGDTEEIDALRQQYLKRSNTPGK